MMQFAAIDFETASGAATSACSLGVAVVEGEEIVMRREWLIRPPEPYFSPNNVRVHGITAEMVADKPQFDALWPEIEPTIGGRTLVAHNAAFDMGVLRALWTRYEIWAERMPFLCSLTLARRCWPEVAGHSLGKLGSEFGIEFQHHNALRRLCCVRRRSIRRNRLISSWSAPSYASAKWLPARTAPAGAFPSRASAQNSPMSHWMPRAGGSTTDAVRSGRNATTHRMRRIIFPNSQTCREASFLRL
jgi:DNA polymerase-3 subunit epsilon